MRLRRICGALCNYFSVIFRILFSVRPKAYFLGATDNTNLGDNAQLLCIAEWIKENYPRHRLILIPVNTASTCVAQVHGFVTRSLMAGLLFNVMRFSQRRGDIIIGNSGYHFIDHSACWLIFARAAYYCERTPILIMPVTVNFLNPWIEMSCSSVLNRHGRVTMLCRDFVSYEKAKRSFKSCRLRPFPDIVTTKIGEKSYADKPRDGILFCLRNDGEAKYSKEEIADLMRNFDGIRVEQADTNVNVSAEEMCRNRRSLIDSFISSMSSFKVVLTDRYHGTIFALSAGTPVVVIDSIDHKLSSGVKWYPESFSKYVYYAKNLGEAKGMVQKILSDSERMPSLPQIFKRDYYGHLREFFEETK